MRYFKRLKTRDGVVGPIEEVNEPRYKEERAAKTRISMNYRESIEDSPPFESRMYRVVREESCLLLELEEQ